MKKVIILIICVGITVCVHASLKSEPPSSHFYIIVGGFASQQNAQSFTNYIQHLNYPARYAYNAERNLYYVYVLNTDDKQYARNLLYKVREKKQLKTAWIYNGILGTFSSQLTAETKNDKADVTPVNQDFSSGQAKGSMISSTAFTASQPQSPEIKETNGNLKLKGKPFVFKLVNASTNQPIKGNIWIMESEKDRERLHYSANQTVYIPNPKSKQGHIVIECDLIGYHLFKKKINYISPSKSVQDATIGADNEIVIPIKLKKIERGNYVELEGIKFHEHSAILTQESESKLLELVNLLSDNPSYKMTLHGHVGTDESREITTIGNSNNFFTLDSANHHRHHASAKALSKHRAEIVKAYLVSKGIKANRIGVKGYGAMVSIYEHSTSNDRIEMEIRKN